ncbi:MAG TPA: hypothetical protein VNA15_07895 [Candidatus Angelobacter sp.]|nr:hypothetical protein [Candidatus Angelobacter sp.]
MPYEGDDKILQITSELRQQLNVTNYNPTSVTWKYEVAKRTRYGFVMRVLPWDQCVPDRNTVILPDSVRDKLEPDEWRPIIASALFYKKKLRTRLVLHGSQAFQ